MEETILYPCIPYLGRIASTGTVTPQTLIRIEGALLEATARFNINLQCGPVPRNNIAVQIYAQLTNGLICLNSLRYGIWDEEQWMSITPIEIEELFEIIVLFEFEQYKIIINGQDFEFPQRIRYNEIGYLCINGDISIIKISYESTDKIKSSPCSQSLCFKEIRNDQFIDSPANTNIKGNSNSTPITAVEWCCTRIFYKLCATIIVAFIFSVTYSLIITFKK